MPYRLRRVYQPSWKVSVSPFAFGSLLVSPLLFTHPGTRVFVALVYTFMSETLRTFGVGMLKMEMISHRCCPLDSSCCQTDGKGDSRDLLGSTLIFVSRLGCCQNGYYCYSTGCCLNSDIGCEEISCCSPGQTCCNGGGCCDPGCVSSYSGF